MSTREFEPRNETSGKFIETLYQKEKFFSQLVKGFISKLTCPFTLYLSVQLHSSKKRGFFHGFSPSVELWHVIFFKAVLIVILSLHFQQNNTRQQTPYLTIPPQTIATVTTPRSHTMVTSSPP